MQISWFDYLLESKIKISNESNKNKLTSYCSLLSYKAWLDPGNSGWSATGTNLYYVTKFFYYNYITWGSMLYLSSCSIISL